MVDELKVSQIDIPSGNINESIVVQLSNRPSVRVGLMFSVPLEEEVYPYNGFGEIAYKIVRINNNLAYAIVLDPPIAKTRLPDTREFSVDDIIRYIPH